MNDTQHMPHRLAALLAWYREMGVSAAVEATPIDWRARGDVAPGAAFVMPALRPAVPTQVPRQPAPQGHPPLARPAAPLTRPPLAIQPTAKVRAPDNVRSFEGATSPPVAAGSAPAQMTARSLAELRLALEAFDGCGLKATAKNLCFYRGADTARVMVIGEAPGREEDLAGKPFVGPAGQLLDLMLAAISLNEADVHITNVVYWRPPGNRAPTAQEALACAPFLYRQIELVGPDVLVLFGGAAAQHMLATTETIMKVRGKWREIEIGGRKIKTLATLHPTYLLRAPAAKRQVWRDLLAVKSVL